MKAMKYLSMALLMLVTSVCMFSCSDDDDAPTDYAEAVSGVYTGKLTVDNYVVEDAYPVTVSKISSTVVRISADFFSDGGENYNVVYEGNRYLFQSDSSSNISITVTGKSISINFINKAGTMTTFTGVKD